MFDHVLLGRRRANLGRIARYVGHGARPTPPVTVDNAIVIAWHYQPDTTAEPESLANMTRNGQAKSFAHLK